MKPLIGIDLGTTNTVLALFEDGRARVLDLPHHGKLLPSAVACTSDGELLVGVPARDRLVHSPASGARRFKTHIGEQKTHRVGSERLDAVALSAMVLREALTEAESLLGERPTAAVITVPAWFREPQRLATKTAAELAGLTHVRLINEPTAAALAWGLHQGERETTVAVLDLGGGTFDVTILELFDGVTEVLATLGDTHLGGEDFSDVLTQHVASSLGHPVTPALRQACDHAKRQLSEEPRVAGQIHAEDGRATAFSVDRGLFARATAGLMMRVERCIRGALLQANLPPGGIDDVLLVGGATRMHVMSAKVLELFGKPALDDLHPDHAVALGASVQAALMAQDEAVRDFTVTDITPHSLGVGIIRYTDSGPMEDCFDPVLHRGTTIPATRRAVYATTHPRQTVLKIPLYQGEDRTASANVTLGELHISDLPPCPEGQTALEVEVRMTQVAGGLVEVEATIPFSGQTALAIIERNSGLTPADRAQALKAIANLKVPARELLPNRIVLERARAIYSQVGAQPRAQMDPFLTAFEGALRHDDRARVDVTRVALEQMTRRIAAQSGLDL